LLGNISIKSAVLLPGYSIRVFPKFSSNMN
jgi:hypothetical protein